MLFGCRSLQRDEMSNILFITHHYPNYVPDLLLHGFRKLLGPATVDYPRKDCLYNGILGLGVCPDDQLSPGWFPPDNNSIDREDIRLKIKKNFFKYIICDIRALNLFHHLIPYSPPGIAIIDGEDHPVRMPPGPFFFCQRETDGTDFSIPLPMALPEEIFQWITSYDNLEKKYSVGFLGCVRECNQERHTIVNTIAKYYPDSILHATVTPSETNQNPDGRFGRDEYYKKLQECKIVLSLRGVGYDTFRFWENAACNAIHISQKMPLFLPNDFQNNRHIFRFSDITELRRIIDAVLERKVDVSSILAEGRSHLKNSHLTTKRAQYLLDKLNIFFT